MKSISFIIPVYNEEKRLKKTFRALAKFKAPKGLKLSQVIFVNDGSTDNTLKVLKSTKLPYPIKIISYAKNKGKGYAVKKGLAQIKTDYGLFFDADIATPINEIKKFVNYINAGVPVIIGTRKNSHSTVVKPQPVYRQVLGKCFTYLSNIALNTWVTDFTCGFKAFSKTAAKQISRRMAINRWGFDSEIMFLSRKLGFKIQEVAVIWADDPNSRVNLTKDIVRSFGELIQIRLNQAKGKY
ncbi:glycosyltransferase, partial [Patescibacteria group bacterium]|nr:glycosyltransferase [Patescibacteria group bacterium]